MLPLLVSRRALGSGCRSMQQPWLLPSSLRTLPSKDNHHYIDIHTTSQSLESDAANGPQAPMDMTRQLATRIMMKGGPLSIAEYMQQVLTIPKSGYYMSRDVFGGRGDFITSPEISQMFGEMVGIWVLATWLSMGQPSKLNLVELGPGRGTLMADLLRGTSAFPAFTSALSVHLVELSPALRSMQWRSLKCSAPLQQPASSPAAADAAGPDSSSSSAISSAILSEGPDQVCTSDLAGCQVSWYRSVDQVPSDQPTIYLAHEFFDALPVQQFVKDSKRGWLEKMIDITEQDDQQGDQQDASQHQVQQQAPTILDSTGAPIRSSTTPSSASPASSTHDSSSDKQGLRFVLSPSATAASAVLVRRRLQALPERLQQQLEQLEISAPSMALSEKLAQRIGSHGGAALIMDYGKDEPYTDSLQAIRGHQGVDVLDQPGSADLSAWVDFSALRQAAEESGAPVQVHGPVSQAHLLHSLGITARLEQLAAAGTAQQAEGLKQQYERLVGEGAEGMGRTYQAMAIVHKDLAAPPAFEGDGAASEQQ